MNDSKISSLHHHKIIKFEKEVRSHLKDMPEEYRVYLFKCDLDRMYNNLKEDRFPVIDIIFYAILFTLRDFKSSSYKPSSENMTEEFNYIFNNHISVSIQVFDEKFLHKPKEPYCKIFCVIGRKKRAIIPCTFSKDLSAIYPKWFPKPLTERQEGGEWLDLDMLEEVKNIVE